MRDLAPADDMVRRIDPERVRVRLSDVWTSWPIARRIAARDVKIRFKQAAIGPLWLLVQPVGLLLGFMAAFNGVTNVDTGGVPYALFALVGITVWSCANLTIAVGVRTHAVNWRFVRLVPCPRIAFVTAAVLSATPNLLVTLALTAVMILASGDLFPLQALAVPLCAVWLLVFLWGLINLLSALNVRFRDIGEVVPVILQGGIFVTPVGYSIATAPETLKLILSLNPLTGIIEAWRWSLLGSPPTPVALAFSGAMTVAIVVLGWLAFRKLEPRFADVV